MHRNQFLLYVFFKSKCFHYSVNLPSVGFTLGNLYIAFVFKGGTDWTYTIYVTNCLRTRSVKLNRCKCFAKQQCSWLQFITQLRVVKTMLYVFKIVQKKILHNTSLTFNIGRVLNYTVLIVLSTPTKGSILYRLLSYNLNIYRHFKLNSMY